MNTKKKDTNLIIDNLIDFFHDLTGNRSIPRLFPNEFKADNLKKYKNKFQQLTFLFEKYNKSKKVDDLIQSLVNNLSNSWNPDLEAGLNKIIDDLNLTCKKGKISRIIRMRDLLEIEKQLKSNPEKKEEILTSYGISTAEYDKLFSEFEDIIQKMKENTKSLLKSFEPAFALQKIMEPITNILKFLPNLPSYNLITLPHIPTKKPDIFEKVEISEYTNLCPLNNGNCALPLAEVKNLKNSQPYAFLIFPDKDFYNQILVNSVEKVLREFNFNLKYATSDAFVGDKFCKICRLVKFSNVCIAELGDLNLNVFLEIGLSIGYQKYIILTLNENSTLQNAIPFNLTPFMNVPYRAREQLMKGLRSHLKEVISYLDY